MSAFRYGWNGPQNEKGSFWVAFDACTREPKQWKAELYAAARKVAARTEKPLWLCSSGGIDSEIMCHAFFDQGIDFSVLTIEHAGGMNKHDIGFAREWCRKHDVAQKIIHLDIQSFIEADIHAYTKQGYIAERIFPYAQLRLLEIVERMGGFAVLGAGEQHYRIDPTTSTPSEDDVFLEFDVGQTVAFEWCAHNNTVHEPFFFYSAPELCLSYVQQPLIQFALSHPDIFRHPTSIYTLKRLVFQSAWTTHKPRPKYHGLEKVLL